MPEWSDKSPEVEEQLCELVYVSSDSLTMKQIKHGQLVYRVFLWQKGKMWAI